MAAATSISTTAASTRPAVPPGLRLRLDPTMAGSGAVDGGWWPRSRDPDAELPGLIADLDASLAPVTRLSLNLTAWDTAPRRVAVGGRRVRVGWFRHMDADTAGVTRAGQDRVALLVVPPQATTAAAEAAMAMGPVSIPLDRRGLQPVAQQPRRNAAGQQHQQHPAAHEQQQQHRPQPAAHPCLPPQHPRRKHTPARSRPPALSPAAFRRLPDVAS
jgi:hypothetical protein